MKSSQGNPVLKTHGNNRERARIAAKNGFRIQFKRGLLQRVKKGISIEKCFGIVWEEIVQNAYLPEADQSELYDELIQWAKKKVV
jgi:hypothetical protein